MKWKIANTLELIFLLAVIVSIYFAGIDSGDKDLNCDCKTQTETTN